jgi:hypothetical protein
MPFEILILIEKVAFQQDQYSDDGIDALRSAKPLIG